MKFYFCGAVFALALSALPFSASADTAPCGVPALAADGYFFSSSDDPQYSADGYLEYHFKNIEQYSDGRIFTLHMYFFDDECNRLGASPPSIDINLPTGVTDWSARFTSVTHIDILDDEDGVIVGSLDIPSLPSYTRATFAGNIDSGASTFTSQTLNIKQDSAPPSFTNMLDTPSACNPVAAGGYYFDPFQSAEYVDGLVRVHLRLKTPYNDGRAFNGQVFAANADCNTVMASSSASLNLAFPAFMRYYSFRMTSPTHWVLWDDENDAALICEGCSGDLPSSPAYVSFSAFIDGGASTLQTTPFPPQQPGITAPVIVIPGILGSQYFHGKWVIDPVLHIYDNLIDTLLANGYQNNVTLFAFPYQWRDSNIDTAVLLKQKIDEVKAACACSKIDIVAHSMGGLVAREYIEGVHYDNDVRRLVFIGTPQLGAPEDYLTWEGGFLGFDVLSKLGSIIFTGEALEHGYLTLFDYLRNKPIYSVQELLPVYDYLKNADETAHSDYPSAYPRNIFLEQLNANVNRLFSSGLQITNIIGNLEGSTTVASIRTVSPATGSAEWVDGYPENFSDTQSDQGLEMGEGDGTVPLSSANFITGNNQTFVYDHNSLPTMTASSTFRALTLQEPTTVVSRSLIHELLYIRDFSPVDFVITAPDGKEVGKNFTSGQDINDIDGAFYSGSDAEDEFVTIPDPEDGLYTITTQGTGDGTYTLEASYINGAITTSQFVTGQTSTGETADHTVILDTGDKPSISLALVQPPPPEPEAPQTELPTPAPQGGGPLYQPPTLAPLASSTITTSTQPENTSTPQESVVFVPKPKPRIHGQVEGTSTMQLPFISPTRQGVPQPWYHRFSETIRNLFNHLWTALKSL